MTTEELILKNRRHNQLKIVFHEFSLFNYIFFE